MKRLNCPPLDFALSKSHFDLDPDLWPTKTSIKNKFPFAITFLSSVFSISAVLLAVWNGHQTHHQYHLTAKKSWTCDYFAAAGKKCHKNGSSEMHSQFGVIVFSSEFRKWIMDRNIHMQWLVLNGSLDWMAPIASLKYIAFYPKTNCIWCGGERHFSKLHLHMSFSSHLRDVFLCMPFPFNCDTYFY